jgi:hypothetical protein
MGKVLSGWWALRQRSELQRKAHALQRLHRQTVLQGAAVKMHAHRVQRRALQVSLIPMIVRADLLDCAMLSTGLVQTGAGSCCAPHLMGLSLHRA